MLGVVSAAPFAIVPRGEEEYFLCEMVDKEGLYIYIRPMSRFVESDRLEGAFRAIEG